MGRHSDQHLAQLPLHVLVHRLRWAVPVLVVALAALYFPLRLILNYRLQKKALEYQYLTYLADHHGVVLQDPKELAHQTPEENGSPAVDQPRLTPPPDSRQDG